VVLLLMLLLLSLRLVAGVLHMGFMQLLVLVGGRLLLYLLADI
jgi:hypothetical protein